MADEEFMFGDLFATVRVQDLPASREVVAVERQENGTWRVCGSAIANTDGIAELGIEGSKASRVYAFAIDHWGEPFTPNRTVAYGDIIRPSVFLGWLYRVTAPGVLPGEEPVWWNSTPGMPRPVGSAMAQAEMYFQPIAHGPVDIEWEDKQEGDPHWDKVAALLYFDDLYDPWKDETGRPWSTFGDTGSFGLTPEAGMGGKSALTFSAPVGGAKRCIRSPGVIPSGEIFTIEAFIKLTNINAILPIASQPVSSSGGDQFFAVRFTTGVLRYYKGPHSTLGGALIDATGVDPVSDDSFSHAVLQFDGQNFDSYLDGVLQFSIPRPQGWINTTNQFQIGNTALPGYEHHSGATDGIIDSMRVTVGVARYTENFTPPTEPFPNFK